MEMQSTTYLSAASRSLSSEQVLGQYKLKSLSDEDFIRASGVLGFSLGFRASGVLGLRASLGFRALGALGFRV